MKMLNYGRAGVSRLSGGMRNFFLLLSHFSCAGIWIWRESHQSKSRPFWWTTFTGTMHRTQWRRCDVIMVWAGVPQSSTMKFTPLRKCPPFDFSKTVRPRAKITSKLPKGVRCRIVQYMMRSYEFRCKRLTFNDNVASNGLSRPFGTYVTDVTVVTLAKCKRQLSTNWSFPPKTFDGRESSRSVRQLAEQGLENRRTPGIYGGQWICMVMHVNERQWYNDDKLASLITF